MVELLRSLLCGVFRRADSSESSSRGGTPGIVIAEPRQQQQPRWSTINHHHHHSSVVVASSSDPSPLHRGLRHRFVITLSSFHHHPHRFPAVPTSSHHQHPDNHVVTVASSAFGVITTQSSPSSASQPSRQ